MTAGYRSAAWGVFCAAVALAGCSSAPAPVAAASPRTAPAPEKVSPPTAREAATEGFQRGKALALAGEAECARQEFHGAIGAFLAASRPDDPEDAEFAGQLWQSIVFYEALSDPQSAERPPVEDTRDTLLAAENAPSPTAEQFEKAKREVTSARVRASFDIPVVVNDPVLRAVAFYQFRTPQAFAGALKRSGRYLPLMRGILREEGLPEDLVYMAMIESAFKANAHSRARAHGFWQFIDGTAKRYGLRWNRYYDERSDPEKSTRAAARYLKDLYEMFGDWYLAMAAYSAGEGKVLKGLQRLGAQDYWQLSSGPFLRRETREYVPFVLAAALVSKDPASYGFDVVPDPPLRFDVVRVPRPVDLARVAEAVSAPVFELQLLNSELKTRITPQGVPDYPVRLPEGSAARLAPRIASLPLAPELRERRLTAKKGDTVAKVAARAGVTVEELCNFNDLPRNARLRKGQVLVVPAGPLPKRGSKPAGLTASGDPRPQGEIRALPTPSAAVTRADEVPPFTAATGAAPALPARVEIPAPLFEAAPASRPDPASAAVRYTVRSGDTLYRIATRFSVTVEELARLNRIRISATLRAGQSLFVPRAIRE
ncbi:MAG TPA: transglycosylase SLT domain-containing protein [Thermoanaerobaculia bacterium]|nr:transglycosylase SLT domain-containing protein [Thermoanaerobaculia bacterium]